MKIVYRVVITCLITLVVKVSIAQPSLHIIPTPVSAVVREGHFTLNSGTRILFVDNSLKEVAHLFAKEIAQSTGYLLKVSDKSAEPTNLIKLTINAVYDSTLGEEGYLLKTTPKKVLISANTPHGLFYGLQTLKQLFPAPIESDTVVKHITWEASCVDIMDYPAFKWRGLMLDVSRHFFSKEEVEQYIDEMAKYKYNVFHWHLTDDQGWRIEIKGLPKLTETGAWRVKRIGKWGTFAGPQPGEKATAGGFYSQDDIREIVAYARMRFVSILPEIDVPGHSLALIASYPNLSCTKEHYPVWPQYAPDSIDNALCVANDSTWQILDKIFTQVAALFPSQYIHVGGDEANRKFWTKDPKDTALMKKEGIKTPAGLQSYFEKKLEKLILSKGKKMIGWDEILEGGLAPEATVMSWRGMQGGIKATQMGHPVIMSPYGSMYISQLQGDPLVEPTGPGMTRIKECYSTHILPKGANSQMVLGGEACLWTEYVPNIRHAEYMTWPRALAAAEVFWGTQSTWKNFTRRVIAQLPYLAASRIKYACSMFDPVISGKEEEGELKVSLTSEVPGLDIYYTFDGTNPDLFSSKYEGYPLRIPKGASEIRLVTYSEGKPAGHQINYPLSRLKTK